MTDEDDPRVSRTITTPKAVITIVGNLSEVDKLYRLSNTAFLNNGYMIPPPEANPWGGFKPAEPVNTDHLLRRIAQLEEQLRDSESHEVMQTLRSKNKELTLSEQEWRLAFMEQSEWIRKGLTSLTDDPNPNLYTHVAIAFLTGE